MRLVVPIVVGILAVAGAPAPAQAPEQPTVQVQTLVLSGKTSVPALRRAAASAPRTSTFSAIGVTWAADPRLREVEVATRVRRAGRWSGWSNTDAEESPAPGRGGADLIWTGPASGVEVVVTSPRGAPEPRDVRADLIDPGRGSVRLRSAPLIHSRKDWGADETKMTWRPRYARKLKAAVLHHTATTNDYRPADVPAMLRAIYRFHAVSRGWGDIGYNVLVDRFGHAWEGRAGGLSRPVIGAHAGGFNVGTTGIAMIGNFSAVEPPEAQRETVAQVLAWKLGAYELDPRRRTTITGGPSTRYPTRVTIDVPIVYPHKLTSRTACPGRYGDAALPWLRDRAAALMADPNSSPSSAPSPSPSPTASPSPTPGA